MKIIPIISLWQPWASLVVLGEKRIETRSWRWPKDLPSFLAIHAAKTWNGDLLRMSNQPPFQAALALHGFDAKRDLGLPFGKVVGVVRIVEYLSTNFLWDNGPRQNCLAAKYLDEFKNERAFGDYSYGRYAWAFDRHLAIEPITLRGHQGLWSWEPTQEVSDWMKDTYLP
jgi:hypothetical protein